MKIYKGEIIHFIGGIHEFIGKLQQGEHPNGAGWYRMEDACLTFINKNEEMKRLDTVVAAIDGPNKAYRRFVDFYLSPDMPIEIRVLDKNGGLHKFYNEEINRVKADRIIIPGPSMASGLN
uniref:Uncharacterized protein n=1 Tax=viral metagenome TaxID=1070528 RepID=A0A6H1ZKN7_9ZZZZ